MNSKSMPSLGIMSTSAYPDAQTFRVACSCHDSDHDVDIWIEVEKEDDMQEVTVTFYRTLETPFWEKGFNRFREAWQILIYGRSRFAGAIILHPDTADNLCHAIQSTVTKLKQQIN